MSYSTCTTCGTIRRDYDERPAGTVTSMPEHKQADGTPCPEPRGVDPWNDGKHVWNEDNMKPPWVPVERWSGLGLVESNDAMEVRLHALEAAIDVIAKTGGKPPVVYVSTSFYWAWRRRWQAYFLSRALGFPGVEPPI